MAERSAAFPGLCFEVPDCSPRGKGVSSKDVPDITVPERKAQAQRWATQVGSGSAVNTQPSVTLRAWPCLSAPLESRSQRQQYLVGNCPALGRAAAWHLGSHTCE